VAWAPGEVAELLAGDAGAGDLAEGGDVGERECRGREGAEEGIDAGGWCRGFVGAVGTPR